MPSIKPLAFMTPRLSLAGAAALVSILGVSAAQAGTITVGTGANTVTVSAQNAAGATVSPFLLDNPGTTATAGFVSDSSVTIGGATITFSPDKTSPLGGIYAGSPTNVATSPFSGTKLTSTNYFVAEPSDPVNIAFNSSRTSFDLLWGSVDTYNDLTIEFCTISTGICTAGTEITGSNIATAAGISANGSTSAFVELSELASFDDIKIISTGIAFEFVPQDVPEPASMALLGFGMIGTGVMARRRRSALTTTAS